MIAILAPTAAPLDTPRISGETRGVFKKPLIHRAGCRKSGSYQYRKGDARKSDLRYYGVSLLV